MSADELCRESLLFPTRLLYITRIPNTKTGTFQFGDEIMSHRTGRTQRDFKTSWDDFRNGIPHHYWEPGIWYARRKTRTLQSNELHSEKPEREKNAGPPSLFTVMLLFSAGNNNTARFSQNVKVRLSFISYYFFSYRVSFVFYFFTHILRISGKR